MSQEKLTIGVIFGGDSPEYEVSCISAASVIKHFNPERYEIVQIGILKDGRWWMYTGDPDGIASLKWETDTEHLVPAVLSPCPAHHGLLLLNKVEQTYKILKLDCIFPVLHGKNGEDGVMQGLLELSGVPYIGCRTRSAAMTMDKAVTKAILDLAGFRQTPWKKFYKSEFDADAEGVVKACCELKFPLFIKPANAGSSKGITKVNEVFQLKEAIKEAFCFDEKIVVEQGVVGRELEIGLLEMHGEILTSCCGEICSPTGFYDYDAKYVDGSTKLVIPAPLPEGLQKKIADTASGIFRALDCRGFSRADFFLVGEDIVFNEINTLPGFTSISMYPKLFAASGIPYSQLIDELLQLAVEACE